MKTQLKFARWLILLLLFSGSTLSMAQNPWPFTGDDFVCLGDTKNYGVINTTGHVYDWTINGLTVSPDWVITGNGNNTITVQWNTAGNYVLQVIENIPGPPIVCAGTPVTINITVYPSMVAGVASANQTICYNTVPALLTATAPTGGNGTYNYQWEFSIDGGTTWNPVVGETNLTYQPGALTQTTLYRVHQVSGGSCGDVYTNNVTITVNPEFLAGSASADQTICYNGTPVLLTGTAPTGGDGTYTYQWEFSIDGGTTWNNVVGANALTYQPGALTQTTIYRLQQISGSGCGTVTTNEVTITVNPDLLAGSISADQTICYNTAPAELVGIAPTGGDGTYTYQWEFSIDGGTTWNNVAGATALNYQPGALTQTTLYRLNQISGSGCGTVTTNTVTITVNPNLIAGVATADQTICYNTIPLELTSTAPSGGSGVYTYEWEFSTDGGTTWNVIVGANALNYQPAALTQTTVYRLHQTSGGTCGDVYTNNVTITVNPEFLAGSASADQTICYNTVPAQLNGTAPTGGDGTYTYQWEFSIDGGATWNNVVGANALTYQPGALTQTTIYRLQQTSGSGCGTVTTNEVTITVNPDLLAGSISADQTICYNTAPAELVGIAPTGGDGTYTYQWEFSIDGGTTWNNVAGATALNYQPGALTQTTLYRLNQISGSGCGTVTTNTVTITVNPNLIAGVATADQTICYEGTPAELNATAPTGGSGVYTYEWEFSIDGGTTWNVIVGANALNYQPGILTLTTLYRLHQTSGGTCGDVYTNNVTITVNPQINTSVISHD
ncbi:MAG: hypothetical protein FD166_3599 [Bacteroidetes bacterium]|nr:MAG: hypothetical protein FD166_3599 [Bacteroidota bacterium]